MCQHAIEFLVNLKMLGFDQHVHFKNAPHLVLDENIFLHGANNSKAFEIISHYLFRCLDKKRTLYEFKECWPVTDRYQSRRYAHIAYRWLEELRTKDNLLKYVSVRKSHLEACHGPTMNKLMLAFSTVVLSTVALNKMDAGILAIHKLNTTELHQRIQMLEARFIDFESIKGNYLHKCRLIGKRLISELDKSAVVTAKNKMLSGFKTDLTALKDQLVTESRNKRQKISSPSNESLSVSSDRSERSKKYTETKDDSHSFAMVKNYNINSANKSISIQSNATTHQNNTFSSDTNSNHNNKAAKNNNTSIHTSINHTKPNTRSDTPEKSLLSIQEPKPTYILPQSHVLRQELVMILDRKQGTLTSLLTLPPFPPQPSFDFAHELKQMMELEKETTPVASTLNHHTVSDTCNTDNPAACQSHDSHVAYTSNNSVADIPSRSTKRYREDDHVYTEPSKRIATSSPIRGIQQQESTYLGFETPYMYSDDEDVPVLNNERPPWKTIGDIYDIDLLTPMRKN